MKNLNKKIKENIKNTGQIYTPDFIVRNILDIAGYNDNNILEKNVIDNSCGNGAFLIEIVKRYCEVFYKKYGKSDKAKLKEHLEKYIHGIEIQDIEIRECITNLNKEAQIFGLSDIKWDLICADTLSVDSYNGKMDFVVGNPPYVRVHNLNESYKKVKEFKFAQKGMTDLYIVFFEISLKMLNKSGKMCLITPSSFLKSGAGAELRKYIFENKTLTKAVDLEHFQPFNATTYTMITLFEMGKSNNHIEYYTYDEFDKQPKKIEVLNYADVFIDEKIYFSKKENLMLLQEIELYNTENKPNFDVKNGFATLADDVFINDFNFGNKTISVLKASTGKWHKCFFPYNEEGQPISFAEISQHSELHNYLIENREILEKRSLEKNSEWFLFGRSQGIKDVFKNKVAVNTIVKDVGSLRIESVPSGSGVYSGLYILSNLSFNKIKENIGSEFLEYIKLLKNYKSGGYYTFSSGELKKFLNYKIAK